MTRNEFLTKLEQNGISLDESRMAEVNYYFNVWCDTLKHNALLERPQYRSSWRKFIAWMKKQ